MSVSDAIRTVTAKVQKAIDDGYRSRSVDADDLVEILLAIAAELDGEQATAAALERKHQDHIDWEHDHANGWAD